MILKKPGADDKVGDDELMIRPQVALVEENAPAPFMNQPRRPWLRRPRRVELALQEKCELVGIRDGDHLNVAAFFPRLEAVGSHPGSQRDILCGPELWRCDFLAVKIRSIPDPRILAHHQ